jgi:hypothetical protein
MVWLPVSERALKKALVRVVEVFAVMPITVCPEPVGAEGDAKLQRFCLAL